MDYFLGRETIGKNQNTFAKRQREMEKKAKAEAKRQRRSERKQAAEAGESETPEDAPITPDDDLQVESAVTGESS